MSTKPSASLDLNHLAEYYHGSLTPSVRSYLSQAGISEETIDLFQIGAAEPGGRIGFGNVDQPGVDFAGRLIFPVRGLDDRVTDLIGYAPQRKPRYKTLSGSLSLLYNRGIIEPCDPVFLCEGVVDAVVLTQSGYAAATVLGGANFRPEMVEDFAGKQVFLAFGSNYVSRRHAIAVAGLLSQAAAAVYIVALPAGYRSPAEMFSLEEDAGLIFAGLVEHAQHECRYEAFMPDTRNVRAFAQEVLERREGQYQGISTGFVHLDKQLLGGLREGLYLLAGTPGMGKTTFMRQLADQVAADDAAPVLFLSMEMSCFELWAKSVAREMELPVVDVLTGRVNEDEFRDVSARYTEVLERVWTIEGNDTTTVTGLAERVAEVQNQVGVTPAVFVDSLQRLPATGTADRGSELSAKDAEACLALKQMSRRLGCPVVVAVSLNREAREINGAFVAAELTEVEHIADVVAILRAAGSRTSADAAAAEMAQDPSRMVLEIAKSRNGTTGSLPLLFHKRSGRFVEGAHATGI